MLKKTGQLPLLAIGRCQIKRVRSLLAIGYYPYGHSPLKLLVQSQVP